MYALTFKRVQQDHINVLKRWFLHPALQTRLESPTPQWLQYVQSAAGVFAWMVYDDTDPVGHVQVDTEVNGFGSVALVVNPAMHNQGYGSAILRALPDRPALATLKGLEGYVEQDNLPAQQCCRAAGFHAAPQEPDKDGFVRFIKRR